MSRKACKCTKTELDQGCFTGKFPRMFGDYFYDVLTFLNATATLAGKPSHVLSSCKFDFAWNTWNKKYQKQKNKKIGLSI